MAPASPDYDALYRRLDGHGQAHVLRFWDRLDEAGRQALAAQIDGTDLATMDRLIETWVFNEPAPETFKHIAPVPVIPPVHTNPPGTAEALATGEDALRSGRVGLVLVAGGQGTRLGFDGPKGAYPIGPVSKRSLFAFHAEKIHNLQRRYGCSLPWYIMVSQANAGATAAFFADHAHFGLDPANIHFFTQRMVPCVDDAGKFMLEAPDSLAMNPNGHGGVIPALVESGLIDDARRRGIDTLSYFQVDNWAVTVADPYFIGYHLRGGGGMSSKVHRKQMARESVGVHCLCDGEYRVIEYSELDLYPQLLETDAAGHPIHFAGNPAIHVLSVGFIERVYEAFAEFPWHRAHKKIPYVDASGQPVSPDAPNGYKFETFVFDALRYTQHDPIALEIVGPGEYTPIKQFDGANSVQEAWRVQREYWARWIEVAGHAVPRDADGRVAVDIEISPAFALDETEFVGKADAIDWPEDGPIAIGPGGEVIP